MSDTPIEVLKVKDVCLHPKADLLEIVKVLNTQFISRKGDFRPDDLCIYFPPDMLIPEDVAETLGVKNYLKHAIYPGDLLKTQCRIGAIRLRGIPSYGFGVHISTDLPLACRHVKEGQDVTKEFKGVKYQPPLKVRAGDYLPDIGAFHIYTNIQHYYRYADALEEGTPVRITEKIHGTNSRVGYIQVDGKMEFMCGTHRTRRKEFDSADNRSLYWLPLDDRMKAMLVYIAEPFWTPRNVIVFGEIFGHKIQSLDYGQDKSYLVFDIMVDGEYLDWHKVYGYCNHFGIDTVPCLYQGPFKQELRDQFISGPTTVISADNIRCKFKGREGIVITPLKEEYSDILGGRLILKAVSPDYYAEVK